MHNRGERKQYSSIHVNWSSIQFYLVPKEEIWVMTQNLNMQFRLDCSSLYSQSWPQTCDSLALASWVSVFQVGATDPSHQFYVSDSDVNDDVINFWQVLSFLIIRLWHMLFTSLICLSENSVSSPVHCVFATPLTGSGKRFISHFTRCILVTSLRVCYKLYMKQTCHLYGKGAMAKVYVTWVQERVLQTQSENDIEPLLQTVEL